MTFKAVIFDLDGTLLDTIDDLTDSMNAALTSLDLPAISVEQAKVYIGDGVEKFAIRSLPEDQRDEKTVAACIAAMRAHYSDNWDNKTRSYDGVDSLLADLASHELKLAILSNKPDDFTKLMVDKLLPGEAFDIVLGARDGVPKKPAPDAIEEILAEFNIQPADVLYLGDTNTDMQTAVNAGLLAVGALWGFRTADELRKHGAAYLLERPTDVLSLLE